MPSAICPSCGKRVRLGAEEALLYEQVVCMHCDAALEVIEEDPLQLEEMEL